MDAGFRLVLKVERNPTYVFFVSSVQQDSVTPQEGNEGMDFRFKKLAWLMPSVVALALAGCGSDSDSTTPVDPTTPSNPAATVPVYVEQGAPTELPDAEVPAHSGAEPDRRKERPCYRQYCHD